MHPVALSPGNASQDIGSGARPIGEPQGSPRTRPPELGEQSGRAARACGSAILALSPARRASAGRFGAAQGAGAGGDGVVGYLPRPRPSAAGVRRAVFSPLAAPAPPRPLALLWWPG